jgi:2-polyprenyl-6-hydroxyphenyl methylase / 3-demethylubiquinone-9 3-methyltransferase
MKSKVNNDYYHHLKENWYEASNDPIAILRAEAKTKNPWVKKTIENHFGSKDLSIADIGCGAGFLTNYLAQSFRKVHGLDASESSLQIANKKDVTSSVEYVLGDAYSLPYPDGSMDVVCAMDFLEHVDKPELVISECTRVLKPNGLFLYHTFNRNLLSWLIVIKFMEWFVPNTPKNLHVLHLFIKPRELVTMMDAYNLVNLKTMGISPRFNFQFIKSVLLRKVTDGFSFKIGGSSTLGYLGYSVKK